MFDFIIHSFSLCFLAFLIKDSEALISYRESVKTYFKKLKVTGNKWGEKGLYLLNCHLCLSFWIALFGVILGILPEWSFLYYPISVAILYKLIK